MSAISVATAATASTSAVTTAATSAAAAATSVTSAIAGVTGTSTKPKAVTPAEIELKAMMDYSIPEVIATKVAYLRELVGLEPITDANWLLVFVAVIVIILGLIMSYASTILTWLIMTEIEGATGQLQNKWKIIFFSLTLGYIPSYYIYYKYLYPIMHNMFGNIDTIIGQKIKLLESFSNQTPDTSLINLQTLAVKQAAYVGPSEDGGLFDTSIGIQSALTSGVRVFVLQISYLEVKKDSTKFDEPYMPTLLYRNNIGELISANGANIGEVAKSLANAAFAPSLLSGSQPLILYLHFERTPNSLREPEKYVKFLSSVAQLLAPLQDHMVGVMPEGNFKRQQNESILLNTPISTFEKKVIVLSNADTSIFRSLKTLGMESIDQKFDLDYMVNLRVYLENSSDSLGITSAPLDGSIPKAVIIPFRRLDGLSNADQDKFAIKGKTRFTIAMPSQGGNPSVEAITEIITKCSVNCVPLNLFGEPVDTLKGKFKVWGNEPFYTIKSPNYRASAAAN